MKGFAKQAAVFISAFLVIIVFNFIFRMWFLSSLPPQDLGWLFTNSKPSLILSFWSFILLPLLVSYFVAFPISKTPENRLHSTIFALITTTFFGVLLFVLLGGAQQVQQTKSTIKPEPPYRLPPLPEEGQKIIGRSYTSTFLGLSLEFPEEVEIYEYSKESSGPDRSGQLRVASIGPFTAHPVSGHGAPFNVLVSYFDVDVELLSWYETYKVKSFNPDDESVKEIGSLDNAVAVRYSRRNEKLFPGESEEAIFVSHEGRIIKIDSPVRNSEELKTFEQILSTFHFLD